MSMSAYEIRDRLQQRFGGSQAPKVSFEFFHLKAKRPNNLCGAVLSA